MNLPIVVVSYRNSTSNHNKAAGPAGPEGVVSYRNSTSNHNIMRLCLIRLELYLIEILHQTTTLRMASSPRFLLYLIEILHQTTTPARHMLVVRRCILSKFYIKPQRSLQLIVILPVVSYRNSTSNHNPSIPPYPVDRVVSYRNSTSNHNSSPLVSEV